MRKKIIIALSSLLLITCIVAGSHYYVVASELYNTEGIENKGLQDGDIFLSHGHSFKSDLVRMYSPYENTEFSHMGFIRRRGHMVHVVHMSFNDGCLTEETLDHFISENTVLYMEFYRLAPEIDRHKIYNTLDSLMAENLPFDYKFDIKDEQKYYCTELVCKVIDKSGGDVKFYKEKKDILYPIECKTKMEKIITKLF